MRTLEIAVSVASYILSNSAVLNIDRSTPAVHDHHITLQCTRAGFPTSHRCNGCPPTAVRLYSPNDQVEDGRSIVLYYVIQLCVIKYQSGNDIHCHQLLE